jgi:hypothetical protein
MSDGSSKPIKDIKAGDLIKTRSATNNQKLLSAKVARVYQHQVIGYYLINNHLKVTGEHNLFINGRWLTVRDIKIGDSLPV